VATQPRKPALPNAKYVLPWALPTYLKSGVHAQNSAYLLGDTRIDKLELMAGIRFERTTPTKTAEDGPTSCDAQFRGRHGGRLCIAGSIPRCATIPPRHRCRRS
jgi:hypothetical protein